MKIMMSAGEASGDLHGGALAVELKKLRPDIELFGMGGSDMQKSGVRIIYDINNLGIIGVVEVVKHIPFFFRLRDTLKQAMIDEKPDALVCIDYPGFNMRLAHVAKELGIPVIYYIAPTIWAWNKGRAKKNRPRCGSCRIHFPVRSQSIQGSRRECHFRRTSAG